jgi:hypothetical protein
MTPTALEPVHAGSFEEVMLEGAIVAAFPRGRHAALASARPHLSFLAVLDGPVHGLDPLDLPPAGGVEVVLLDNAAPGLGERLRYVAAAPNRILYRVPERLPASEAWALVHAAARGAETSNAVPQTRGRAVLAAASELVRDPSLLAAWREQVGPDADASLVIVAAPAGVDALAAAVASVEADGGEIGDLVAFVAADVDAELARLAPFCHTTLGQLVA